MTFYRLKGICNDFGINPVPMPPLSGEGVITLYDAGTGAVVSILYEGTMNKLTGKDFIMHFVKPEEEHK